MEKRFCLECGNEIVIDYIYPTYSFRIGENNKFIRDDNMDQYPGIEFYCSEDRSHNIGDNKDLSSWQEDIKQEFENQKFDLLNI